MQQDEGNNRRLVLAAGLCLLVLMAWPMIFPPPKSTMTHTEDAAVATSTSAEPPPVATTTSTKAKPQPTVPPELYTFRGEVDVDGSPVPFQVDVTNVGGGIERFVLESYFERDQDNRATTDPIQLSNPTMKIEDDEDAVYRQMASLGFLEETTFEVPKRPVYEVVEKGDTRGPLPAPHAGGVSSSNGSTSSGRTRSRSSWRSRSATRAGRSRRTGCSSERRSTRPRR